MHLLRRVLLPLLLVVLLEGLWWSAAAKALDSFDKVSLADLKSRAKTAQPLEDVSTGSSAKWTRLGPGIESPCVVVKTDGGNWTKVLVSWAMRKGPEKPIPVLLLERYVTYDATRSGRAMAAGKEVQIFPGYQFDFDTGQVVPEGLGGDITFAEDRKLKAVAGSTCYAYDQAVAGVRSTGLPVSREEVKPTDFSGDWTVNADGRWRGTWQITADEEGNISGAYLSDDTQSTYKLLGKVDLHSNRIVIEVELLNSNQLFEGYLWTSDKSTVAGITTLEEKRFGFYATRIVEAEQPAEKSEVVDE